jgi:hypothetical protein
MFHSQPGVIAEKSWENISKYAQNESLFCRVIYPCFFDRHFTLVALDCASSASRPARITFVDPLKIFHPKITSVFHQWLKYRNINNFSTCQVDGGIQGDNVTECGIFLLQNMEAMLDANLFFSVDQWQSNSKKRTVDLCIAARKKYQP